MKSLQVFAVILCSGLILSGCSVLKGKPAGIQVISNIPSKVTIDGKDVGTTPFQSADYPTKKYTVNINPSEPTFTPHETTLKLYPGYIAQLDWNFGKTEQESSGVSFEYDVSRDKQKAELQLVASPDNVPVSVDGKNMGFTPLLLQDLADGNHAISFQAPGYTTFERTVKLIKGTRIMMTVKLAKELIPEAPIATESAELETATPSGTKSTPKPTATPKATPKATAKAASASATVASPSPSPSSSPTASSSGVVKKSTSIKPYVEVLDTPTGFLRVRDSTSASATELYKLAIGSTVPYANASASGWLKVTYDGTKTGWVSGQYAKLIQ
jgi:hypothetical protein